MLKDVTSRFTSTFRCLYRIHADGVSSTAIIGAYYFGTSLYPETKTFRFLADVINDTSIVLDTISPYLVTVSLSTVSPHLPSGSTLQVVALCISGALRSLCGLVAGGSKAALTNHFASPVNCKGDVGELNAKSASRSTVIALTGVLVSPLTTKGKTSPDFCHSLGRSSYLISRTAHPLIQLSSFSLVAIF